MLTRYRSADAALREMFGCKVYKLALSCAVTCPNRDGSAGTGGCIFCGESGSGEFAEICRSESDVNEAIERAKARVSGKAHAEKYSAYFQSYTSTYMPAEKLRDVLLAAADREDIAALSVATRPDCLPADITEVLREAISRKPLFVELGLQTIREDTAKLINRGYTLAVYDDAVIRLKSIGANVITHIIVGLPEESKEDAVRSAAYAGRVSDGIKLQSLFVLRGTRLADMYESGEYVPLTENEYIDALCDCVKVIPKRVVLHRLTGDPPKRLLIAPLWTADKKRVRAATAKAFEARNIIQGSENTDK